MAVAHGDGLPAHGAATETRTISGLEDKVRDLIVLRTNADLRMSYERAAVLRSETRASVRDVAALMGISHQRVHQLLAALRAGR